MLRRIRRAIHAGDGENPIAPPGPADLAPGWNGPLARIVPYVFAITSGFQLIGIVLQPEQIGFDARLYAAAARAWLTGSDPWDVASLGVYYAAPPTSLIPFAPFAFVPDALTTLTWVIGSFVLAWFALRALGAPMWWLAWWPIVDGCLTGNANVAVLALLVVGGGRLAALAPILKIYAIAPLIGDRRWRILALSVGLLVITIPLLPWGPYLARADVITAHLQVVAATTSVFGQPILMAIAVVALLALGIRRAAWLSVPVLWPYTQPHYLVPSIPALSPFLAIAWSFPHPLVVLGSVVVEAGARWRSQRASVWRG